MKPESKKKVKKKFLTTFIKTVLLYKGIMKNIINCIKWSGYKSSFRIADGNQQKRENKFSPEANAIKLFTP